MRLYSFEKLEVWNLSRKLTKDIYIISKGFPEDERFGLTSPIRRSVISVSSNIAEGTARKSGKEQCRFTEIAFGSLMEVLSQIIISVDLGYCDKESIENIRALIEEIGNKLNKLSSTQLSRYNQNKQINR